MPKKRITLVRPGHEEARKALARRNRVRSNHQSGTLVMYMSLAALWMQLADGVVRYIAGTFVVLWALLLAVSGLRSIRANSAYRRHLDRGDFITVDRHLICVWDELRAEEDVHLSAEERDRRIDDLFHAAQDLSPDLARRKEVQKEVELRDEALLIEARIRARLLREVALLKQEQETRRQLAALAPDAIADWATADEVEHQLRVLRERQKQQAGELEPTDGDEPPPMPSGLPEDASTEKNGSGH